MRKLAVIFVVPCLLFAACGGGQEARDGGGGSTRRASAPPKPSLCPLTATPAPSGIELDRPALSVKIENAPDARPQSGLENADMVYEQLAEGGITRFNAIYHCADAGQLGPVRSARAVDPDILIEFAPARGGERSGILFAYAGAAPPVQDKVAATEGIIDLRHGSHGKAYRRERSRRAPHNLFSSTDQLRSLPDAQGVSGPPETGLQFEASQSPTGAPSPGSSPAAGTAPSPGSGSPTAGMGGGNEVSFSFGGRTPSRYTYDASSGNYLRFHGTQPHQAAGGGQLSAANVLVYKVQVRPGAIRDAAGNASPEITVVGNGEAIVLSGGKSVVGKWNRPSLSSKTTLTDAGGAAVKLRPGSTWIHLVPSDQAVTVK